MSCTLSDFCKGISVRKAEIANIVTLKFLTVDLRRECGALSQHFHDLFTCFVRVTVIKVIRKLRDVIFYFSAQKVLFNLYSVVHFISRWNYVCIKGINLRNVAKLKLALRKLLNPMG